MFKVEGAGALFIMAVPIKKWLILWRSRQGRTFAEYAVLLAFIILFYIAAKTLVAP